MTFPVKQKDKEIQLDKSKVHFKTVNLLFNSKNNIDFNNKKNDNSRHLEEDNFYEYKTYTKFQYIQKRIVDFVVGSVLFLVTLPVMFYVFYRVKKESKGPILFTQSRVGLNGKTFTCYKFRSMHVNSKFNPYTQENDSRIFPFGNTMRKMRIDELPQLINVLKGEMHLIGPRAEWDILVEKYEKLIPNYHKRHLVAPGITGLAQVCYPYGRNVEDAIKKLEYDMEYIKNWSLFKEIKVMWKTVEVILGKRGM